ncbi:MAG: peptide deformylase, partial [Chloroflexota bacterium]
MEGCLSFPGIFAEVTRPKRVAMRALDIDGKPFELDVEDLPARALLHDGAPYRCLESSSLAGVEEVDLQLIASRRDFDLIGVRSSEGWAHFSAALSNAGQRLEHLTYRHRPSLDDRAA